MDTYSDFLSTTTSGAYGATSIISQEDQLTLAQILNTPLTTCSTTTSDPSPLLSDWFLPLQQDNTLKQSSDVIQDLLQLLPISPPLTASPTSSIITDIDNDMASAEAALVALFPDIIMNNTPATTTASSPSSQLSSPTNLAAVTPNTTTTTTQSSRRLVPVAPKPVAIMPKSAIPIAPRPIHTTTTSSVTATPNTMKRKIGNEYESDEAAMKRQKNTDAARRSRLKKIIKMENLEKQVTELESDNARLTTRVAVLESEKSSLIEKDKGLEDRIRVLEAQLAEAHRALTKNKD
ncbi:MAG: hypothetical protein EXX96DRAFT_577890 [Benjaminiella poitrasii]|nr:MAG: hypothetical protein EXX96DRAFT_577890 [Benjaminiella poitrasii]